MKKKSKIFSNPETEVFFTWQDNRQKTRNIERAKRALEFAKMQNIFWTEELKFWEEIVKENEVCLEMKLPDKPNKPKG